MNNPFIAILTNGQSSSGAAGSSNSGGSGSTGDNSKNHPLFSQEPWRLYQGAIGHRHVCVELSLLPLQQILTRLFPFGRGAFTPFPLLSRLPAPSPFPPSSFVPPLLFPLLLLCPLSFPPFCFCAPSPLPPSSYVSLLRCPFSFSLLLLLCALRSFEYQTSPLTRPSARILGPLTLTNPNPHN